MECKTFCLVLTSIIVVHIPQRNGCDTCFNIAIFDTTLAPPLLTHTKRLFTCEHNITTTVTSVVIQKGHQLLPYKEVRSLLQNDTDVFLLPSNIGQEMSLDIPIPVFYVAPTQGKPITASFNRNAWCNFAWNRSTLNTSSIQNIVDIILDVLDTIHNLENIIIWSEGGVFASTVVDMESRLSRYGVQVYIYQAYNMSKDSNILNYLDDINKQDHSFILVLSSFESIQYLLQKINKYELKPDHKFTLSQKTKWLMVLPDTEEVKNMIELSAGVINNVAVLSIKPISGTVPGFSKFVLPCQSVVVYTLLWKSGYRLLTPVTNIIQKKYDELNIEVFPNAHYGLNKKTLVIVTNIWPPFVSKSQVNGKTEYDGFCIDLLRQLSNNLNFSYTIVEPADGEWGSPDSNNVNWTGIVGDLQHNIADIAIAPLAATPARRSVIKYTYPYYLEYSAVILQPPNPDNLKYLTYVTPFTSYVLMAVAASLILGTVILYLIEYVNPFYDRNDSKPLTGVFWYLYGALLTQGGESLPTSLAGRKFVGFWWLFCIMLVATYSGNLVAFLTISRVNVPFSTIVDMVKQTEYKWGTIGGSSFTNLFLSAQTGVYSDIGTGLKRFNLTDTDVMSTDHHIHSQKVQTEKYAYIADVTSLSILAKNCSLHMLKERFLPLYYSIALPTSSSLESAVSKQIVAMTESGILSLWKSRWWPRANLCTVSTADAKAIQIIDVQSAFYIVCIGLVLSCFVLAIEYLIHKKFK